MDEQVKAEIDRIMSALFPLDAGTVNHHRVHWALDQIAARAFSAGRSYALSSLLTTEDVAEQFGITTRRVRAIATARHQRFGIGFKTPRGDWLFTPEEIDSLRPGPDGRPAKPE